MRDSIFRHVDDLQNVTSFRDIYNLQEFVMEVVLNEVFIPYWSNSLILIFQGIWKTRISMSR